MIDTRAALFDHIPMDDDGPLRPEDPVAILIKQPLDPLSLAELDARVAALEAEIERVRAHRQRAVNHKSSAEALFKK
jgi:uncharacterized small protein (DUF1192 family)